MAEMGACDANFSSGACYGADLGVLSGFGLYTSPKSR